MIRIRLFEEKVQELFMTGEIGGSTHLCQGQEAVSVGAVSALLPGDVITNTYRGHGEALAMGMPPETAFAELIGRSTGSSQGVGGSMHLADPARGNLGANAIVGAGIPIAVGAAVAFQLRREPRVAVSFFGDGATNIGTFHEALNIAATWRAPVVFIAVNNLYAEYSPLRTTTPIDDLAVRAASYGIPGLIVDGQDLDIVRGAVADALAQARAGNGPSLLEMKTYRYRGHSRSDPAKYRPAGELDAWRARDPIEIFGHRLVAESSLQPQDRDAAWQAVQAEIDVAAAAAVAAPFLDLDSTRAFVYADQ
jgi:pyruvate dehydrogenase E1 component alpha subunit